VQQNAQRKQQQQPSQKSSRHPDKGYESSRAIPPGFAYDPAKDPEMGGGQERYGRDDRYYEDDARSEYKPPGPGFKVPRERGRDEYNGSRGMQVEVNSPRTPLRDFEANAISPIKNSTNNLATTMKVADDHSSNEERHHTLHRDQSNKAGRSRDAIIHVRAKEVRTI
jgi:hypothetical protein